MTLQTSLAAFALAACLGQEDSCGLPAPDMAARWAEALRMHAFHRLVGLPGRRPESVAMIDAILAGNLGPGQGWFGPGESRLGWAWLAARMDADGDGRITRDEFRGPDAFFARLDRDGDGVLTPGDFGGSPKPPPRPPKAASKPAGAGGMPPRDLLLAALFRGELGSPYEGPRIGKRAPRFNLPTHDGKATIALDDLIGGKPVVLIFGSFT